MTFRSEYNVNRIDTKHSGFAVCGGDAAVDVQSTVVPNTLHEMVSLTDKGYSRTLGIRSLVQRLEIQKQ